MAGTRLLAAYGNIFWFGDCHSYTLEFTLFNHFKCNP